MGIPVIINSTNTQGEFQLSANDESGVTFQNETSSPINNLSIKAEGKWNGGEGESDAGGLPSWSGDKSKLKYSSYTPFSLIGVYNGRYNDVRQLSQQSGVTLAADNNFTIAINDIPGTYCENTGQLKITWHV